MAFLLESLDLPKGWSRAYIEQLASYVNNRDNEGWYYGNKAQFEKRHKEIKEWVNKNADLAYQNGVVFKK